MFRYISLAPPWLGIGSPTTINSLVGSQRWGYTANSIFCTGPRAATRVSAWRIFLVQVNGVQAGDNPLSVRKIPVRWALLLGLAGTVKAGVSLISSDQNCDEWVSAKFN